MFESPGGNKEKQIDETVFKRGPLHQKDFQAITEKLKEKFDDPALFNPETQKELDSWTAENKTEISDSLQKIYLKLRELKSTESPGHELAHILDNLNSAVRIFEEYGDFSEAEKLEVVLSCLGHDLGRYVEKNLDQIDPKNTLFLMPALVGRQIEKIIKLPQSLQLRVLYDIASGSVPKTERRTADTVHQCDREYLTGSRTVARDLAFDVVLANRELMVPRKEEFRSKLPMPESPDDKWFLVQMEFFMRNVYPPASPEGNTVFNGIKKENAVIEMLATEGKEEEFKQIFTPELGITPPENLHWSKKPIPAEVFMEAQKEKNDFLKNLDLNAYVPGDEMILIKNLIASDKISLPPDFDKILTEKLDHCTDQERKNLWLVVKYALSKRQKQRLEDLPNLGKIKEKGGISAIVADWVIDELNSREEIYKDSG